MSTPKIRFKGFTDDWEQWKLKELVEDLSTGKSVNSTDELVGENDIGVLKTSCVSYDFFDANECKKVVTEEIGYVKCPVEKNCIIVSRMNTPERVGACGFVDKDYPNLYLPDRLWKLKFLDKYDVRMIHCMLISPYYKADILSLASGTSGSMYNISKEDFENIELKVPSKDEQLVISKLFNNLDSLITLHQRKCDELQKVKKYMLQKMFPKKGEKVPEIRFAGFTGDWEQREFGSLLNEKREKTSVEDEDTLLSCAINGMYLNSELFSHFRGQSNIGYLKVKKNDLILSAQNLHLGNCNVNLRFEHGIISPAYKVYGLVDCNPLFVQAWVKMDKTKEFFLKASTEGASVCRKNIVWEELYKQELPVPSFEEQTKIGEYFANLDNLIALHQRKCDALKEIKKYMLQNMFPKK